MTSKYKAMFLWTIWLMCKVVRTSNEVVLVHRNIRDIFRVGKDGCANNTNVCTSSATCQVESGLCFCKGNSLNFINRVEESSYEYSCVSNDDITYYLGNFVCEFGPFKVIPYRKTDAVKFKNSKEKAFRHCFLGSATKSKVKFPDNGTEMEMQWLNKSYVNLTVSNSTLFFKWKRSVPHLQGTIIKLQLLCRTFGTTFEYPCFQAKVLGTWSADVSKTDLSSSLIKHPPSPLTASDDSPHTTPTTTTTTTTETTSKMSQDTTITTPTITYIDRSTPTTSYHNPDTTTTTLPITSDLRESTPPTTSQTTPEFSVIETTSRRTSTESSPDSIETDHSTFVTTKRSNKPTTYYVSLNHKITSPRLLARSRPPREVPDSGGNFQWALIVIVIVVSMVIIMVLVFVAVFLFKRRKEKNQINSRRGSVQARSGSTSMNESRDPGNDAQALDLAQAQDIPAINATASAFAESNPIYSTQKCQTVVVVVNPCYGVPDVKTKDVGRLNSSSDPAYDAPDAKKEQDNGQSDGRHESIVTVENVDNKKNEINRGNSQANTNGENIDIKMEPSDLKSGKVDGVNLYDKPAYKSPDVQKDQIDNTSSESTYAKPDKKRETSDVKGKGNTNPDSYEEPGYEALDITKKENDGRNSDATYAKPNKKGSAGNIKTGESIDPDSYKEPGYETPDATKKEIEGTTTDTTYAKPNKKRSAGSIKTGESIDPNFLEEPGYENPDLKKKEIDGSSSGTTYAKPDKKRSAGSIKTGENIHPGSYEEPGYETPDTTKKEVQGTSSDVTYAKPDKKRKEVGPQGHSASDKGSKNDKENAGHSTPDIKRTEINGDLYALPDKSKNSEKADGLDKDENPADMVPGSENGSERQDQSGKATAESKMEKYKEL